MLCETSPSPIITDWCCAPPAGRLELRTYFFTFREGLARHAEQYADALSVRNAEMSMMQRIGASEREFLVVKGNVAGTYRLLGQLDQSASMRQDVYLKTLKLEGEESYDTLREASNYASNLLDLRRFKETKSLLLKVMPVARRVIGDDSGLTLKLRINYAVASCLATGATLDDLREAVTTLEETDRIARRVLGCTHPLVGMIKTRLRSARKALRTREPPAETS